MQLGRQGLDGGVLVTGKPAPGYIGQIVASGLTWEKNKHHKYKKLQQFY